MAIKTQSSLDVIQPKNPWANKNIKFPCLASNVVSGNVVLFRAAGRGTVISGDAKKIGNQSVSLRMHQYIPLPNGATVTLSQKLP